MVEAETLLEVLVCEVELVVADDGVDADDAVDVELDEVGCVALAKEL